MPQKALISRENHMGNFLLPDNKNREAVTGGRHKELCPGKGLTVYMEDNRQKVFSESIRMSDALLETNAVHIPGFAGFPVESQNQIKRPLADFTINTTVTPVKTNHNTFVMKMLNKNRILAQFRLVHIGFTLLLALLLAIPTIVGAQTTVNKRLYLKNGLGLNRVVPTATTLQSTISLIKSPATHVLSGSGVSANNGTAGAFTSANYTVAAGNDRIFIVGISSDNTSTVTQVTFAGQPLTKLAQQLTTGNDFKTELWYILLGTSASATTGTVNVNFTGTNQYVVVWSNFTNVNQTVPFGQVVGNAFTNTSTVSYNIPSALGDVTIDMVGVLATGGSGLAANADQTATTNGTAKFRGGFSRKTSTPGQTTMGWTNGQSGNWATLGSTLKGISNSVSFLQNPTMCSSFTIKAGQTITVLANAAVTSGTASGTNLPMVVRLYHGTTLIFEGLSAANSGLGATNSQGTLTWTGTIASDYTIPTNGALTAQFLSDYPGVNIRIDYDATTKISYIQLPTTTYINVAPNLVFDAAYSSGAAITQRAVGFTNYLRAVVSDPFGSSDITGLNFSINGGTPIPGTLVNTAGCTKTYEYVWTPTTAGNYTITATAIEGTEGTVTHTATQSFNVVQPSVTVVKTKTSPANPPFTINDNIVYNIAVTNTSPVTLTTVPLQDLFSSSCFEFVTASVTPNSVAPGVLTWNNLGSLAPGATVNLSVTLKVKGNCDPASNTARVQGAGYVANSVTYVASTKESTVNINIDVPPVATSDNFCVQSSTSLSVLANDTDSDVAGFLSAHTGLYHVTIVSAPAKGTATVNGDKTIQFNPTGGTPMVANEVVTFTYRVAELAYPQFWSEATVQVLYNNGTTPPSAATDLALTSTELPVVIDVLANDSPIKSFLQAPSITVNPNFGTVQVNPDKTITYTPFVGFEGTDVFTYQVCHSGCQINLCATAQVSITVVFAYYVCKEGSSTIQVNPVPGAISYKWTLPAGATVTGSYSGTLPNPVTTNPVVSVNWTGVNPGKYNICVEPTNDCGPGTEQCVEVVVNKVVLSATPNNILCYSGNNGYIDLSVSGGIEPYTYKWYKDSGSGYTLISSTVQDPGGLTPGSYKVEVTDKYGCFESLAGIVIQEPAAALSVSGSVTNVNPYPLENGAISLSVSGGTTPYLYQWSKVGSPSYAAFTQNISNLNSGIYRVLVTDANGCWVEKYFTVNRVGGPLEIFAVPTNVACFGNATGAIDLEVIGGNAPYSYAWTGPGGPYSTQDLTGLAAGTYNVTVTDSDTPVKTANLSVIVQGPAAPLSATINGSAVLCAGLLNGWISLTNVQGGTAPYTYLWNTGAVSQNLTNLGPGSYSVTITDAKGCLITRSFTISGSTPLIVTGVVSNASCQPAVNGSITLSSVTGGTSPYTYLWSNGATTQNISNLTPGIYAVTITDANGCVSGKTFLVETACLYVNKTVIAGPVNNGNGSYTLTFQVTANNTGQSVLSNIQLNDNLSSAFPSPASFSLVSAVSTKPTWIDVNYNGTSNTNLFIANQVLTPGDMVSVNITVTVTPGVFANPYNNIVNGSAVDNTGAVTTDQANQNVTFTENPVIGVAKALTSGPIIKPNGSYDLTFTITVRNYGNVPLSSVQVADNLDAAFGAGTYTVTGLTAGSGFTVNGSFNGSTIQNLLSASTPMAINEIRTITLSLNVTPTSAGPFNNQAAGSGYGPGGTMTSDLSHTGLNPDPDNDGNPANNNTPTTVTFPENPQIGLAKQLVGNPVNNNNGTYTFTYEFRVKNTGDVILYNVQVTDNLSTTFGGAPVVVNSISSATLAVNGSYNGTGDNNLLTVSGNTLAVGETKLITLTVTVTPGSNLGPYNNSATASGTSAFGTSVTDISHDGTDVDPENDGPGNNSTPTPVTFTENPLIGLAKAVGTPVNNNDGTYDVTYTIYVRNYGDVPLVNVQVADNLSSTFTGAVSYTVRSISVSGTLAANTVADFITTSNLLVAPSSTVAYNTTQTITLVVRVTPGTKLGIYNNSATGTAAGPGGTPVTDISHNGTNPAPGGGNNPGNFSQPTPVSFTENPAINVEKTIFSGPTDNLNNTYTLTYQIRVENTGDVPLTNLQLADNLAVAFAGAASYSVNSTTITQQPATTTLILNGGFNGNSDPNLLNGSVGLNFGESAIIRIQVTVSATPLTHPGGPYVNQVAALANSPGGSFLIDLDDVEVTLFENPAIRLTKTVESVVDNGDGATQRVTIRLQIENIGDVNLFNLAVFDDIVTQFSAMNPINFSAEEGRYLSVNPSWNGTGSSNILASGQSFDPDLVLDPSDPNDNYHVFISFDVTPGLVALGTTIPNTAQAEGYGPLGTKATDADDELVTFLQPALTLDKTITSGGAYQSLDDIVVYRFRITNTGDVTLTGPFTIVDDKIGTLPSCATGPLAPGNYVDCTGSYSIIAQDLSFGSVTNEAYATALYGTQTVQSNTDNATANSTGADLKLTKTVSNPTPNVGEVVTFTIAIENLGPSNSTGVSVQDVVPSGYGNITNISNDGSLSGSTITWSGLSINNAATLNLMFQATVLEPGAGVSYLNTAMISASNQFDPDTDNNEDSQDVTPVVNASIAVIKTASVGGTGAVGDVITYTFTVTNTGNVTLTGVQIDDVLTGSVDLAVSPSTLAPGATGTATATYTITQADLNMGYVENQATGTGSYTDGNGDPQTTEDLSDDDSNLEDEPTVTPLNQDPSIEIVKFADPQTYALAGDVITYTFTVTNTGNVTLSDVVVSDVMAGLSAITPAGPVTLAPEQQEIFTATYTITFDDLITGLVTNTATVSGKDPNGNDVSNSDDETITQDPNEIVATDDSATGINGYTGQDAVLNVFANDLLNGVAVIPSEVTLTETVAEPNGYLTLNADGTVDVEPGTPAGTYTLTYEICEILNPTNCDQATVTVTVNPPLILAVDDDYTTSPVNGFTGNTNVGNVLTNDELNNDPVIPSEVAITLITPALHPGVSLNTATGVVSVAPLTPGGTYTLTYRICEILNPTNCDDAVVTVEVIPTANLAITKTDAPDPVLAGNNLTWTITVSNLGPSPAENVVVTDAVPASVTSPQYSTNGGTDWFAWTGSFNYPVNLASGSNFVLLLRGTVNPGTAFGSNISNTASLSSATLDPVPANNSATSVTQVTTSADLAIAKVENADPILAGEEIIWTITVTNNGPSNALSVNLTDVVPPSVLTPQFSLDGGSSWSAWTSPYALGTLTAGSVFELTIRGAVNPSLPHGTVLNNTATVTSTTPDPNTGNNTSVASTTVNREADISIVKKHINPAALPDIVEVDPSVITAGSTIYYLLLVSNNGPSYAQNVVIADDLPAGITNIQYSLNFGNSWFTWNGTRILLDFEYPGTNEVLLRGTVSPDYNLTYGNTFTNTATVTSPTYDPFPDNNQDDVTTTVNPSADLLVIKEERVAPLVVGGQVEYRITVTNNGPSVATNVLVEDVINPLIIDNATYSIGSAIPQPYGSPWQVNVGNLNPGQSVIVNIYGILLDAGVIIADGVTNTVTVSSPVPDPNPINNIYTIVTEVGKEADLEVVLTGPDCVIAGTEIMYDVTVTNLSATFPSSGVVVIDHINPSDGFILNPEYSLDNINWLPWTGSVNIGTLDPEEILLFNIRGDVPSGIPVNNISNTAQVTGNTPDPDQDNNTSTVITCIEREADLEIVKLQINPSILPVDENNLPEDLQDLAIDPAIINAGEQIYYLLVYTNHGPSDATNVTITDMLPAGITNWEASRCQANYGLWNGTGNAGTVVAGGTCVVVIRGYVYSDATGTLSNTATIASDMDDPVPGNNTSTFNTPIGGSADLFVHKSASPNPVAAGATITYTITAGNNGPSDALDVVITDVVPVYVTNADFSLDGGLTWNPWSGSFAVGTVVPDAEISLLIRGTILSDVTAGTIAANTVTISGSTGDPVPANNTSTAAVTVFTIADLTVVKAGPSDPVEPGDDVVYTISVTNNGPSDALDNTVTDTLPSGVTFVSASDGGIHSFGSVSWSIPVMEAGETILLTLTVNVNPDIFGNSLLNTVAVSGETPDPVNGNNSDTEVTDLTILPALNITKTADRATFGTEGEIVTYTFLVENTGNIALSDVMITDPLTDLSVEVGILLPGATATYTATYAITFADLMVGQVLNIATVSGTDPNGQMIYDFDEELITAIRTNLSINKTGTTTLLAGQQISYLITVTNQGLMDATNVQVTDVLHPAILNPEYSLNGTDWFSWSLLAGNTYVHGNLLAYQSFTLRIRGTIDAATPNNLLIENMAVVTSDTFDPFPSDNSDEHFTLVNLSADLAVTKISDPVSSVKAGESLTYTITVTNNGPSYSQGVILTESLPAGVTITASNVTKGTWNNTQWTVGTLAVGEVQTLTLTVLVDPGVVNGTNLLNSVVATSQVLDPVTANNTANDGTLVTTEADLVMEKLISDLTPAVGSTVTFTLKVTNSGPANALSVAVADLLPSGYTWQSHSGPGTYAPGTGVWTIGTVAAGSSATLLINAVVNSTGSFKNSAEVTSSTSDPDPSNNYAEVTASVIYAVNDTYGPVNGYTGNTNAGNVLVNDLLNGSQATVDNVDITVLTPAIPLFPGASVPALNPATGTVSVPAGTPAGIYTIDYQICEVLDPTNCDQATVIITVIAPEILAEDDTYGPVNGYEGNSNVGNILDNDELNSDPADIDEITITVLTPASSINGGPVPSINTETGIVSVPSGTPAGVYTIEYQICENLNPANCDPATVIITVTVPEIVADNDTYGPVNGYEGNSNVGNILVNDKLNSDPVDMDEITITVLTPASPINGGPVPSINTETGIVSVPAGTPAGIYTIEYQICENLNPANCDPATVIITVTAPEIVADNDTYGPVNGYEGNSNVGNILDNDELNSDPADIDEITITVLTPASSINGGPVPFINTETGIVSVPSGTPAGVYTIEYQICENLNPTNCDEATVTVTVTAPDILAVDDSFGPVNGFVGEPSAGNVLTNDKLNDQPVLLADVVITVLEPATPVNPGDPVPVLDPATGTVSVPAGTPAGIYTIKYEICDILNPGNCDVADVTVEVGASPIVALSDLFGPVSGITGSTNAGNALTNDLLNNLPVNIADITVAVTAPATPKTAGASVPVLDITTGIVSVPAGTPAGIYTIGYQICDKLNPTECDDAIITVIVSPVANDDLRTTMVNTSLASTVVSNDDYPAGSQFSQITGPAHGTLILSANGSFIYVPDNGFAGVDVYTYQVCLPAPYGDVCDDATVTIVVGPDAVDDGFTTPYNTPVTDHVRANDVYPAGSDFSLVTPPAVEKGTLAFNNDGSFTFTPAPGFTGEATFTYAVCFTHNAVEYCDQAMVTITVQCPDINTWMAVLRECAVSIEGNPTALFHLPDADVLVTTGDPAGTMPPGLTVTYHNSFTQAQSGTNPLASPYLSTTANVWARVSSGSCYAIDIVQLVVYTPGVISMGATDVSCHGADDGSIVIDMQGAPYPFVIEWITGGLDDVTVTSGTQRTFDDLPAGTYTARITDGNGCIVERSVIITEPEELTAQASVLRNVSCYGGNNGSATVDVSGGTAPYFYLWSNGSTDKTATGLTAGIYSVTVLDDNGCFITVQDITITQPGAALQANITTIQTPSCSGNVNGQVEATAQGGTAPYTYLWSNGQTNALNSGLSAGTYTVVVTDAMGCTATSSVVLNDPTGVVAIITEWIDVKCFGDQSGSAEVSATGGTAPYTYQWSLSAGGQTTKIATNLPAGQHTVTVTDKNGCEAIAVVNISQPTLLTSTIISSTDVLCSGTIYNGTATVNVSGGVTPYTYIWSAGTPSGDGSFVEGLPPATHSVTVTDANGCEVVASVTISQPTPIVLQATPKPVLCYGQSSGSIDLTVTGGTPPYSYNWNNGAADVQDPVNLAAGDYTVVVTDFHGCQTSMTVTIQQPAGPIITGTPAITDANCAGNQNGSVQLSASGGTGQLTFTLNTGLSNTTGNFTNLSAGWYSFTVTDINGCNAVGAFEIKDPANLLLTINNITDVSCYGGATGQATVTATGGITPYTFVWRDGTGTLVLTTLSVANVSTAHSLKAGNYTVTVYDKNNCSAVQFIRILQPAQLAVNIIDVEHVSCEGGSDGSARALVSGGTMPYTYSWNTSPVQSTATATGLSAGNYMVTITDANSCQVTASVKIDEPSELLIAVSPVAHVSCRGGNNGIAHVGAIGGNAPYSYVWITLPVQTNATATGLKAGTYTVIVTDANGCTKSGQVTITEPLIALSATAEAVLPASCGLSNGEAVVIVEGGEGPYTYFWSNGAITPTAVHLSAGGYTVTVTDSKGCQVTAGVNITDSGNLTALITQKTDLSCFGGSDGTATVEVTGGTGPYQYNWSGNPEGDGTSHVTELSAGYYTVTITDQYGCIAQTAVTISQPAAINAVAVRLSNVSCNGGTDGSAFVSASGGTGQLKYLWSNGETTASVTNLSAGIQWVDVTDANDCTVRAEVTISQPDPIPVDCAAYNGFSPVCLNTAAFPLNLATPAGGTYTGPGVTGNIFNPAAAGNGVHTITYTVTQNGCSNSCTFTITVNEYPVKPTYELTEEADCIHPLASFTITNYDAGYTYLIQPSVDVSMEDDVVTAPPGTYTVIAVNEDDCQSDALTVVIPGVDCASISGTVLNDLNRLTDNTVNGVGTNAGGLYANLVDPVTNLVIASISVEEDGSYLFTYDDGVVSNEQYLIILTTDLQISGDELTVATLPPTWISTGENVGTEPGHDGMADSKLLVNTSTTGVTNANFGIVRVPDVTPVITAVPNVMNGPVNFYITVRITELNQVNTNGLITVRIPKDTRWMLNGPYDPSLAILGNTPLHNNQWSYSQDADYHIFTSSTVIPAGGFSYFGFNASWNAGETQGIYTITSQIISWSGGEVRIDNNVDAEKLDYFIF